MLFRSVPASTVESEIKSKEENVESSRPDEKEPRDSQILESVDKISHTTEGIKVEEQPAIEHESYSEDVQLQDITYLADIFESAEEVEPYQMRLCIVQKDDTLHSIAERYEIPTQQIVHLNKLDDDQVLDGQLLLIPTEK